MTIDSEVMSLLNSRTGRPEVAREDAEEAVRLADRYNGWTNRETWAASLHLTNDPGLDAEARAYAEQDTTGEALEEWLDTLADEVFDRTDTKQFTDFGSAQMSDEVKMMIREIGSLWRVNWRELRASLIEE